MHTGSGCKEAHPDLAVTSSGGERTRREELAKQINEAYSMLHDLLMRRHYDLSTIRGDCDYEMVL